MTDRRKVFVVHGRDNKIKDSVYSFLRAVDLKPTEWTQAIKATKKTSPYIGEILDAAFSEAQAIVVILSPDEEVMLRHCLCIPSDQKADFDRAYQARPNVYFEAGLAFGRNPDRTILIEVGNIRSFSDIYGRHVIKLDNSVAKRQEFLVRLEVADCMLDRSGIDWQSVGDFTPKDSSGTKDNNENKPRLLDLSRDIPQIMPPHQTHS